MNSEEPKDEKVITVFGLNVLLEFSRLIVYVLLILYILVSRIDSVIIDSVAWLALLLLLATHLSSIWDISKLQTDHDLLKEKLMIMKDDLDQARNIKMVFFSNNPGAKIKE